MRQGKSNADEQTMNGSTLKLDEQFSRQDSLTPNIGKGTSNRLDDVSGIKERMSLQDPKKTIETYDDLQQEATIAAADLDK